MASTLFLVVGLTAAFFAPTLGHGNRKGGPMRCGLPPFADKLPADAKAQLETIWAGYVDGQDCTQQREATKALMQSLPESVRAGLRPPKGLPPCGLPPFTDKLPADLQSQVLEIWADYVAGQDCQQKQQQTRDLLNTLTEEQRKALRPQGGRGGIRG